MHPSRRWRTSRSRARSSRMHHASYPVFVHRPAASDWASSRPRLATTPLPFSLPSALRKPGHRTFTYEVTRHARRTRPGSAAARRAVRCNRLLYVAERSMVLDLAGRSAQKAGLKLHNHEHFFWHFIFAGDAKAHRRRKPETRHSGNRPAHFTE